MNNSINYEACYQMLGIEFGLCFKEVNKAWRRLSMQSHPDKHHANLHSYNQALEKQKQINHARDLLKKWFELNPGITPPRSCVQSEKQSKQKEGRKQAEKKSKNERHSQNEKERQNHRQAFMPPAFSPSLIQVLIKEIDRLLQNKDKMRDLSFASILAFLVSVIAPLYAYAGAVNFFFPEFSGHYPAWLAAALFLCGILSTGWLLAWYFCESELIKIQERRFRFDSALKSAETEVLINAILLKYAVGSFWTVNKSNATRSAELCFEEVIFAEIKSKRTIELIYQLNEFGHGSKLELVLRVKSPFHSFFSKNLIDEILADLKSLENNRF